MLIAYLCLILCFQLQIQPSKGEYSARELDFLLQDYAFKAFSRPRTGIVYNADLPANFSGVQAAAMRLRSGSLRRKGVSSFKEFHLPVGVVVQPYVERVVLVYHNLDKLSHLYYPLPGYTFLAPILGLLVYDATNLSAMGLSELDLKAFNDPISVNFTNVKSTMVKGKSEPKCVYFGLDGSVVFDKLVKENTCSTTNQGHFSIVVEELVAPAPAPGGGGGTAKIGGGKWWKKRVWIIVGCVIGGVLVLILLALLLSCVVKCISRKKMRRMELASERGVVLSMVSVGQTKAPIASESRTRPVLENEFVP